jgi:hypothetical protein
MAQSVQGVAYGMDVSEFESRLRNELTIKICGPNLKPSATCLAAGVQVDL